ncbi:MAG: DUF2283 domain-containing protein [Candidatus Poribacteria bacterium]|nr:DUF2283 domain-containing protein [Candidatus Poribacteria bacterium]
MRLNYYPDTDSLYINLSEQPSVESQEISEGVLLDYDADGRLVGIDIDNASHKVDMEKLILSQLPCQIENSIEKIDFS